MNETPTPRRDWTVIGTGVALLAVLLGVLVPLQLSLYSGLRADVAEIRRDLADLDRRVARIEGRLDAVLPAITLAAPEADQ